jgi:hypothetical protein
MFLANRSGVFLAIFVAVITASSCMGSKVELLIGRPPAQRSRR